MKKLLSLLLTVLLLCGCSAAPEETTQAPSLPPETVLTQTEPEDSFKNYEYQYASGSRERNWEEDIVFLADTFLTKHPMISDVHAYHHELIDGELQTRYGRLSEFYDEEKKDIFLTEIHSLIPRIPELTDSGICYELQRIAALLGDGHSSVTITYNQVLPICCEPIQHKGENSVYVVRATSEYQNLLFSKLISINGLPVNQVVEILRAYTSCENTYFSDTYITHYRLGQTCLVLDALKAVDVLEEDQDTVRLEFENTEGEAVSIEMHAYTPQEIKGSEWVYKDFYALRVAAYANVRNSYYWYDTMPQDNAIYFRIYDCAEHEDYPFEQICQEVLTELAAADDSTKLIIDLRGNTGGTYPLSGFEDFMRQLNELEKQQIYVLIDHFVASSATAIAAAMKTTVDSTLLVGVPSGQPANMFGASQGFTMPNSGTTFRISTRYFTFWPGNTDNTLIPDITVCQTLDDYRQGIDTVLETVLSLETEAS